MAETLSIISLFSFVAASAFGILTIVLWFLFKIPAIIGDLSGRNAKKSIELMRKNNEKMGDKSHKADAVNAGRGKPASRMVSMKKRKDTGQSYETGLLKENMAVGYSSSGTEILRDGNVTVQMKDTSETVSLETEKAKPERKVPVVKVALLEEIMYIHTEEVI